MDNSNSFENNFLTVNPKLAFVNKIMLKLKYHHHDV